MYKVVAVSTSSSIYPFQCPSNPSQDAYDGPWLVRQNIPKERYVWLNNYLDNDYRNDLDKIREAVKAIRTLNLRKPILRDPNLERYLFAACEHKLFESLTEAQNAMLAFTWIRQFTPLQYLKPKDSWSKWMHGYSIHRLGAHNSPMPLETYITELQRNIIRQQLPISEKGLDDLANELKALPQEELFALPVPEEKPNNVSQKGIMSMNAPLSKLPAVVRRYQPSMCLYPSASILNVLRTYWVGPDSAIEGIPTIGAVSPEDFQIIRANGGQPISVYSREVSDNLMVPHGRKCGPFLAAFHDLYHIVGLKLSKPDLAFVMDIVYSLQNLSWAAKKTDPMLSRLLDQTKYQALDLDIESAPEHFPSTVRGPFTQDLNEILSRMIGDLSFDGEYTTDNREKYEAKNKDLYVAIRAEFTKNRDLWREKHGRDIEDLWVFPELDRFPNGYNTRDAWEWDMFKQNLPLDPLATFSTSATARRGIGNHDTKQFMSTYAGGVGRLFSPFRFARTALNVFRRVI